LTAYIANTSLPDEIASALDTKCIFLFSLLVSMVKSTTNERLKQIDALVLMQLPAGGLFGVLSLWGYRTCHYQVEGSRAIQHYGGFGTHARLFISVAISIYGLWFWMHGIRGRDGLNPVNDSGCETLYTFFFAKFPALGGIRVFYVVMCVMYTVYFGTMLLISSVAGFTRAKRMIELARSKQWAITTRLKYRTGWNKREYVYPLYVPS
jgi:hypothetical protein